MGIDAKYGRVDTEFGNIDPDEPVFVIRAQDTVAPLLLRCYESLCRDAGSPPRHLAMIAEARVRIEAWQADPNNLSGTPDSRSSRFWLSR